VFLEQDQWLVLFQSHGVLEFYFILPALNVTSVPELIPAIKKSIGRAGDTFNSRKCYKSLKKLRRIFLILILTLKLCTSENCGIPSDSKLDNLCMK